MGQQKRGDHGAPPSNGSCSYGAAAWHEPKRASWDARDGEISEAVHLDTDWFLSCWCALGEDTIMMMHGHACDGPSQGQAGSMSCAHVDRSPNTFPPHTPRAPTYHTYTRLPESAQPSQPARVAHELSSAAAIDIRHVMYIACVLQWPNAASRTSAFFRAGATIYL